MMKLILCLLIVASMLTGCMNLPIETTATIDSTTTPTTVPPTTEISPLPQVQSPMVSVSVPGTTHEFTADDGTILLRYFRQDMSLIVPEHEVADMIILDFLNRVDQSETTAQELLEQARSALNDGTVPYLCSLSYAPERIDQTVLSLYGNYIVYSGGAHPTYSCCAANYDMLTGNVLTLGSILSAPESKEDLCQLVIEQLDRVSEEKFLWPSYPDTVKQRFAAEESYDENWYFSNNGLCFFFAPYEIAAYASGVIIAEIPYEQLAGIIDDAYFLPELDTATGTLTVIPAAEADLSDYSRFSELIIDPDASAVLVCADSTVHHVRISDKNNADGNQYTTYAAQILNAGDAIVIEANETTLQHLIVTYESNGSTVTLDLSSKE